MLKKYLLGGDSVPTAGDGYSAGVAPRPAAAKERSPSSHKRGSTPSIAEATAQTGTMAVSARSSTALPRSPQDATKALRSSEAIDATPTSHLHSPGEEASSTLSFQVETPHKNPEQTKKTAWQDREIPKEMFVLNEDVPQEIRNIVQESLDEQEAVRASRMQTDTEEVTASPKDNVTSNGDADSASASRLSVASSPTSESAERKGSSFSRSQESITTVESDPKGATLLQPPKLSKLRIGSHKNRSSTSKKGPQDPTSAVSPGSDTVETRLEARVHESKDRTSRSRGLYKLLKAHKTKSSREGIQLLKRRPPPPRECTSCFDDIPHEEAVPLPCQHFYCRPCFSQLVNTAILNEDTFPPKCCLTEIPKTVMRKYISPEDLAKFDEKTLEYAVPVATRYYTVCRGASHPANQECPQDFGLIATLETSEQAGWRRCPQCGVIVELNTGCRHITCKCRAEFCYTCGRRWRTCHCTEADQRRREEQLQAARVQREADARAEEEEVRRAIAAVEAAERQIREEREAEEARERERLEREAEELAQLELQRTERIVAHFTELRTILDRVGMQQKQAMEKRHFEEEEADDHLQEEFDKVVAEREKQINAEKAAKATEIDRTIKQSQKKHAAALMETLQRHRRDQDALFTKEIDDSDEDPDTVRAAMLERLMPLQEMERTALKQQQAREVEKWRRRGQQTLDRFNHVKIQQMRFDEEEKMMMNIHEGNEQRDADLQWFEVLQPARFAMLAEDERRLLETGGDIADPKGKGKDCGEGCSTSAKRLALLGAFKAEAEDPIKASIQRHVI